MYDDQTFDCASSRQPENRHIGTRMNPFLMDGDGFDESTVSVPKDECIRRARADMDTEIVPVIERMAEGIEWPTVDLWPGK